MISRTSYSASINTYANRNNTGSDFLSGMQAWNNKQIRKAEAHFQNALENEQLTPDQLSDMGDFFRVTANRNKLAAACYEKSITTAEENRAPVPNDTRINLSRCLYQQWQKSIFKKPEVLQQAGDQMEQVLNSTTKPFRISRDFKLFAEQRYPNPRQAAEVGLRLSKQCANLSEAKSILSHVAAKITTRCKQQPFGAGSTSYLDARYKPSFSELPAQLRDEVADFLCDHRHGTLHEMHSEAYAALSVIPKEQIPLTAAKMDAERAKIQANQFDQRIIGKYIKG